jgi:hypothetical protein
VAIVCFDIILCCISLMFKAWLIGSNVDAKQIVHSWVIVPIGIVALIAINLLVRMTKAHKWGCLPTVIFMISAAAVWFIPLGR